jgi:two-component system response regulator
MRAPHLLLVEDTADDAELTLRALRKHGLANEVVHAEDGEQALQALFGPDPENPDTTRDLPCVVLLDLKLPKVDGFEVLRGIRRHAHTKHLPVVILTSSAEDRDVVEGYSLGANSYVRKPVAFDEFIDAVGRLGVYWVLLNRRPEA